MKLLLIAVVFSIHTTGFLTTAKVACEPLYNGGYGGTGGANVKPRWSFNSQTNHCQIVMVKSGCPPSHNCFLTKEECQGSCDPWLLDL
uniref:Putative salivary kunitz domain protein n=1 Tax=Ixodes ricinus TaxID=34613 RepID=A0A0K8RJU4_IXORI